MRAVRTVASVIMGAACLLWLAAPAWADPPGNNGTIKIDGVPFDQHPNNESHVGCAFQVDFYGYDAGGITATATFRLHPPTGADATHTQSIQLQDDPAGGGTDLDGEMDVDLSATVAGLTPHPIQGFHVFLTVRAPGSIGSDVKHKVFWVTGCGGYPLSAGSVGGNLTSTEVPASDPGSSVTIGTILVAGLAAAGATTVIRRRARRTAGSQ